MRGVLLRRLCAILCLFGAVAVLPGCGAEAPVRVVDGTLRVTLDEYRIRPQSVEVRAGELRIVARNAGRLPHNVKVEELERKEGAAPRAYGGTPTARPGQTVRSRPIPLEPGVYELVCTVGNHRNLGQYGELRVLRAGA